MALTYVYPDAYLDTYCTEEVEARAIEEVALMAGDRTLSAEWEERLVILQAYILAALENQAKPDDLFAAKLKNYRDELAVQLPRALAAADATADVEDSSVYAIAVSRA
jgi:hypothetical protein